MEMKTMLDRRINRVWKRFVPTKKLTLELLQPSRHCKWTWGVYLNLSWPFGKVHSWDSTIDLCEWQSTLDILQSLSWEQLGSSAILRILVLLKYSWQTLLILTLNMLVLDAPWRHERRNSSTSRNQRWYQLVWSCVFTNLTAFEVVARLFFYPA